MEKLKEFLKSEASGGVLLLVFAFAAIVCANTSLSDFYFEFLQTIVSVQFGEFALNKPLLLWVNDGLMAVFFTLVGLEVKKELFEGSLSSYKKAIFPAIAAVGGMIVPAIIYWAINQNHPEYHNGWAIPMATDIAFAVGIVALLGTRVPLALKAFLLALAIIDDLGAIVVIAIFYSQEISVQALTIAAIAIIGLVLLNRFKVTSLCAYLVVGLVLWTSVLKSGVHATLAGVIIGFCVPLKGKHGERPAEELEHILAPWCAYMILPIFAFANAGVYLLEMGMEQLSSPLPLGIALGLIIGKTLGVFGFSYLAVLFRLASLPQGVNFKQIFAIAVLCGIGFTMSMFLASLAFDVSEAGESITALARLGILLGSAVSAILGYTLLRMATKQNNPENNATY
ncbi:TPA: Na+/H+ antiporter NhaA [Mannheimia haemolytica]|uniref:Na(+)/H(+) antiporter NhaA n=1 Tax=Mannheimia haemolytica TaxID=75985 RepID=A0A249A2J5_MANHA|nr:Na+/H+ antiporter NhaA [Mannheimia haemolytica]AWW72405.1 Na+/H+ antiporter NhaA [Pasteurellaceae bacterium 12565]AGI33720.1 Na+/H+ antiporter NhaA [Mannheimia haemolytica USDA-ARS-USMARC-183]AGI34367.1 Na+/H+ antiporter NhaA [Mannheimia haemolytica USDA-ARS-USMARC-185]AGK01368.1 Na(+)/H(+) antiporter NhaA [Mannheimia haemolytica M42548]AGQ26198.1 sodium:proton antiporter [Mannheimia haemolytica D153]